MSLVTKSEAPSTREKLLEAAGRLFLARGYDGVSVRDITLAAGVNVAAVNYHFNGKKNLYREFFRRRISEVAERKIALLADAIHGEPPADLRDAIRLYVMSFFGEMFATKDAEKFLKLFTEEMSEGGIATDVLFREISVPLHRVMKEAIRRARPGMSEEKASLCIFSITGQMFHFVRAREIVRRMVGRGYSREFIGEIVEHITEFSLKGIGMQA